MNNKIQWYFLGAISLIISTLSFFIFRPFITSIAMAVFLALLFYPLYKKILSFWPKKETLTAIIVVIIILIAVIGPLSFLTAQLFKESQSLYSQVKNNQTNTTEIFFKSLEDQIQMIAPSFSLDIGKYINLFTEWIGTKMGGFVFGTIESVFLALLIVFLFYYFLRHGGKIKEVLIDFSPLPNNYDLQIMDAVKKTVNSVLKGTLLIAIIQGILVGVGLWIFQIPNPAIWGSVAAASALIPGIGTGLVLIPAVLYLFFNNLIPQAIGLGIWGIIVVGLIDNILVPIFYGKNIRIHPVFVLLSVLGGISFFGFSGFIFGPVILSLLIVLLDIYKISARVDDKSAIKVKNKSIK